MELNEKSAVKVVLSFGSNISPRREYLEKAMDKVCAYPRTRLLASGEIEETEPVGVPPEYGNMKFLNRVAIFETGLGPMEFSRLMHRSEDELGRVRGGVRNAPRTIDIDMIDYGGIRLDDPELTLPHPRWQERAFVLIPLADLFEKARAAEQSWVARQPWISIRQKVAELIGGE